MINQFSILSKKYVSKIILIIIIISFLLTSISSYLIINSKNYVIKVNNVIITKEQLQNAIQQEYQILQEQLGNYFSKILNNKQERKILFYQTLERLMRSILLKQFYNHLGLNISDNKIKEEIYNTPIFQTNGFFNKNKYLSILSKYKVDDFIEEIKQKLIDYELKRIYVINEFLLPEEINNYARLVLQKRKIQTTTLYLSKYQSHQKVTDQELKKYYFIHNKDFLSPFKIKVSYIKLDTASQLNKIKIKNNELKKYYQQNISNFIYPEKKIYSMLEFKTQKEANIIYNQIIIDNNFNGNYKKNIIISNKNKYNWIPVVNKINKNINFTLIKKGQVSNVINVNGKYVIYKLDDVFPKKNKSFELVKKTIFKFIKNEKLNTMFSLLKQKAKHALIINNQSLSEVEKVTGIKAIKTEWFDRNHIPSILNFDNIINSIYNGNLLNKYGPTGFNSNIINIDDNNAFIIRVDKYIPAMILPLEKVKKTIINLIKSSKAIKKMENDSRKLINLLNNNINAEKIIIKQGIHFTKSQLLERNQQTNNLVNHVFNMPIPKNNKPSFISIKDNKKNLIIIKLIKLIEKKPSVNELKTLSYNYQIIRGNLMLETLILNLRDNAKIDFGNLD